MTLNSSGRMQPYQSVVGVLIYGCVGLYSQQGGDEDSEGMEEPVSKSAAIFPTNQSCSTDPKPIANVFMMWLRPIEITQVHEAADSMGSAEDAAILGGGCTAIVFRHSHLNNLRTAHPESAVLEPDPFKGSYRVAYHLIQW